MVRGTGHRVTRITHSHASKNLQATIQTAQRNIFSELLLPLLPLVYKLSPHQQLLAFSKRGPEGVLEWLNHKGHTDTARIGNDDAG